jgi:hypothetical protein
MPPNQSVSACQAWDEQALEETIMAMGRRHDRLRDQLTIVNNNGLHRDSRCRGPTDNDDNLLTLPE